MRASFSPVSPPPVSQSRRNLVDSADPRQLPVTAAEKKASTQSAAPLAPAERDPTMTGYLKAATVPRPAPLSRHDPVAILDRTLELWV